MPEAGWPHSSRETWQSLREGNRLLRAACCTAQGCEQGSSLMGLASETACDSLYQPLSKFFQWLITLTLITALSLACACLAMLSSLWISLYLYYSIGLRELGARRMDTDGEKINAVPPENTLSLCQWLDVALALQQAQRPPFTFMKKWEGREKYTSIK